MPSWSIINAPKFTSVAITGLAAAIAAARPGEVITVATAGGPLTLNLSGVRIAGYGVCVLLPLDQQVRVIFDNCSNIHFFGGRWCSDLVSGSQTSTNQGFRFDSLTDKVSLHGGKLDRNFVGFRVDGSKDIWLNGCVFEVNRGDQTFWKGAQRIAMTGNTFGKTADGLKICYYQDGREPRTDLNSAECTASGGTWADSTHNDVAQVQYECQDVTIRDNVSVATGAQGFISFGDATPNSDNVYRAEIVRNRLEGANSHGINFRGTDLRIVDNVVLSNPDAEFQPGVTAYRFGAGGVRGGRNSAPQITSPSGVDLASAVENGDPVTAPEFPRIVLPPWRPATPVPTLTPPGPPYYLSAGAIWPAGNPTVGTYLSVQYGGWVNVEGISFAFRWTRNGVVIPGATTPLYRVAAPDTAGTIIGVEIQATNPFGSSAWTLIDSRTVA